MSELALYSLIMMAGYFASAVSQVMLKKSAEKHYSNRIKEYLNPLVIIAYLLFFSTTLISVYAFKVVPLSTAAILESAGYIFVTILSYIFLKEKLATKQLIGIILIVIGIIVYNLSF